MKIFIFLLKDIAKALTILENEMFSKITIKDILKKYKCLHPDMVIIIIIKQLYYFI